jgi:hypothetical protein
MTNQWVCDNEGSSGPPAGVNPLNMQILCWPQSLIYFTGLAYKKETICSQICGFPTATKYPEN